MQLEELFGSKHKIRVLRYLVKNPDWHFNMSTIGDKIKVDKGNVSRIFKQLEDQKLILIKREGRNSLFKINDKHEDYKFLQEVFKKK